MCFQLGAITFSLVITSTVQLQLETVRIVRCTFFDPSGIISTDGTVALEMVAENKKGASETATPSSPRTAKDSFDLFQSAAKAFVYAGGILSLSSLSPCVCLSVCLFI